MDEKKDLSLYSRLVRSQNITYILADRDLRILAHSASIRQWIEDAGLDPIGHSLPEVFPEFIGVEELLNQLQHIPDGKFTLPQVHRSSPDGLERYLDLQVEMSPECEASFLIIVTDVTEQTQQTQQMQQQRNELQLLSSQLHTANEKLAYIIKRFVPEQEAQKLIRAHQLPQPGGEGQRQVTLFFADMRNYSGIAEKLLPEQALELLNEYLNVIAGAVLRQRGYVLQLVGDMVMAVFDDSVPGNNHPLQAVRAALDAHASLERFNAKGHALRKIIAATPDFGIGINTGWVTAGYLSAGDRYQYTMTGDATNVAYHLCSQAAAGQVIISQSTLNYLGDRAQVNRLGKVYIKRRREPLQIYELVGLSA